MITISHKNINTIVDEFIRKPNNFESYMKYCINILKNINILKMNKDTETDLYEYFKIILNYTNPNVLIYLYDDYRKDVIKNISTIDIKTNVLYIDKIRSFTESMQEFMSSEKITKNENIYFSRMMCKLYIDSDKISNKSSIIDTDKTYTINELFDMCNKENITIVDSYVKSEDINAYDVVKGLKSGELVISKSSLTDLDFDEKIISDYNTCKNEFDRKIWYIMYSSFLKYIKENKMFFDDEDHEWAYNFKYEFDSTINHTIDIINTYKSKYRKKKKQIPNKQQQIINETLNKINIEKDKFYTQDVMLKLTK